MDLDVNNMSNLDNYSNISGSRVNRFYGADALATTTLLQEVSDSPTPVVAPISTRPKISISSATPVQPVTLSSPTTTVVPFTPKTTLLSPQNLTPRPRSISLSQAPSNTLPNLITVPYNPTTNVITVPNGTIPVTNTPVAVTPLPVDNSMPTSMGGGGGGGGSVAPESTSNTSDSKLGSGASDSVKKNKHLGFITLAIVGAAGAYFYAKYKDKNILTSILIGASIGGLIGFSYDKVPSANEIKPATA